VEDLSVHLNVWNNEELKTVIFPRLKRLTVSIDLEHPEILEAFLTNHLSSLEVVDIAITDEYDRD